MDSSPASPEDDNPAVLKRKRSPKREDSEDESYTGRSATDYPGGSATPGTLPGSDEEGLKKRPRLDKDTHSRSSRPIPGLPLNEPPKIPPFHLDIWQRICSFLDPTSLGRLICVDRTLNAMLDPQKRVPAQMVKRNLTQNDIWVTSRKRLLPGVPRPLSWISELDLWKLLLGTACQFCGKKYNNTPVTSPSTWTSGPGQDGVRIIWPFAVRSCGKCLGSRMKKDADLRFSDISILLPGLPYAYFTPDLNFVTSIALRASSPPHGLELTRYYFQPQLDEIKLEMDRASTLGQAAAAEWVKGIIDTGNQKMEDAKRFEHWESKGGIQALSEPKAKNGLPVKPMPPAYSSSTGPSIVHPKLDSPGSRTHSPSSVQYRPNSPAGNPPSGFNSPHPHQKPASHATSYQPPGLSSLPSGSLAHSQGSRIRNDRNVGDINQRKADRRLEIERRCQQLNPPIKSSTLPYMVAFNNAMQIAIPLNDNGWEVLKPLLISQHDAALKKEEEFVVANKSLHTQAEERREHEDQLKRARALLERQRDEAQRPVREKLGAYANEIIETDWENGAFVTKDNVSQFAADLLVYVRRRFFEELDETDKSTANQGPHTPSTGFGPNWTRRLSLEDMKWVFDNKIKPITQRYSKEIFLCGACDIDRKLYAFDAVIQHYAAKHTNDFSQGSATVYWKAEWPLEPPFDPKPTRSPRNRPVDHNGASPMQPRDLGRTQQHEAAVPFAEYSYPGKPMFAMTPDMAPRPLGGYAASTYSVDEEICQPRPRPVPVQASVARQGIYGSAAAYETYYMPVSPAYSAHTLPIAPDRRRFVEAVPRAYPAHHLQSSTTSPIGVHGYAPPPAQNLQNLRIDRQPLAQPGQPAGFHQIQIAELARNAREIFDGTDGIVDLPDSVRIHVIIHHVVLRFHDKYTNEPTLALFTDALRNNSQMKPLSKLCNLTCKVCASEKADGSAFEPGNIRYNLLDLLKHFQIDHVEIRIPEAPFSDKIEQSQRPDWKFDMVQLPGDRAIERLIDSPGMTKSKLRIIATILWRYFPEAVSELNHPYQVLNISSSKTATSNVPLSHSRQLSPNPPTDDEPNFIPLEQPADVVNASPANVNRQQLEIIARAPAAIQEDEYDPHRLDPALGGNLNQYEFQRPQPVYRETPQSYNPYHAEDNRQSYRLFRDTNPGVYYERTPYRYVAPREVPQTRYYERDEFRDLQHVPTASRPIYRPVPEDDRDFEDQRSREPERSPEQVKVESLRSPDQGLPTGTTQFLNNYDVEGESIGRRGSPEHTPVPDRSSNNASSNRSGRAALNTKHPRERLDTIERPMGRASRTSTPRKAISRGVASARSRSPSEIRRDDPRAQENPPYSRIPAQVVFDREPAQNPQYPDPLYRERPIGPDDPIPPQYEPIDRYRTRSPGRGQQAVPLRYVGAQPITRYRYLDDPYEQPGRKYVQVMPRDGSRYIERRVIHDQFPQYVEDSSGYGGGIIDGEGQVYDAAPPPSRSEVRYDPYDDRRRYQ